MKYQVLSAVFRSIYYLIMTLSVQQYKLKLSFMRERY
jgi:hypothetical protein